MNRLDRSSGGTYPEDLAENQAHGQRIITALRKGAMSVQELVDVLDGPTYGVLSETLKRGLNKNIGSNSTMTVSKNGPTNKGARRNQHVE